MELVVERRLRLGWTVNIDEERSRGLFSYLGSPLRRLEDYGGIKNLRCGTTDLPLLCPGSRMMASAIPVSGCAQSANPSDGHQVRI